MWILPVVCVVVLIGGVRQADVQQKERIADYNRWKDECQHQFDTAKHGDFIVSHGKIYGVICQTEGGLTARKVSFDFPKHKVEFNEYVTLGYEDMEMVRKPFYWIK
jgi:hypothetical protein